jgi:hypothetical protein
MRDGDMHTVDGFNDVTAHGLDHAPAWDHSTRRDATRRLTPRS